MNLFDMARDRMRRSRLNWILEEARWDYYLGDLDKSILRLLDLEADVIQEPPFDSEEYRNGERKSTEPDDEQEEEQEETDFYLEDTIPDFCERGEDGYLIR